MAIFKMSKRKLLKRVASLNPTVKIEMDKLEKLSVGKSIEIDLDVYNVELRKLVEESVNGAAKDKEWKTRSKWIGGSIFVWRY